LLQKRYPAAEIWSIDDSPHMLAYAKAANSSQVHWLCTSLDTLPVEDHSMDLVAGNLVLPWCGDLKKVMQEWRRVLKPEGLLIFSTYGPDTLHELREQKIALPHFADMHDLGDLLMHGGFADPVLDVEYYTLTYKEQQQLQHELQLTGFISQEVMLTPLEKNSAGVIPLTYEIIYGHAWKPVAKKNNLAEDGVFKFPLAQLRGR
jgi:malonyl-CoA O-methyltransferase